MLIINKYHNTKICKANNLRYQIVLRIVLQTKRILVQIFLRTISRNLFLCAPNPEKIREDLKPNRKNSMKNMHRLCHIFLSKGWSLDTLKFMHKDSSLTKNFSYFIAPQKQPFISNQRERVASWQEEEKD